MIPGNQLGSIDRKSRWLDKVRGDSPLEDFEIGGVGISDSSLGLRVQTWRLSYESEEAALYDGAGNRTVLFSRPGITHIALAFDQLMAPFVAMEDSSGVIYWWFDPQEGEHVFSDPIAGAKTPCATMDDTRQAASTWSDIILAYLKGRDLYYRQQRDNYSIERLLESDAADRLVAVGMGKNMSLQFRAL